MAIATYVELRRRVRQVRSMFIIPANFDCVHALALAG